VRNPGCDDRWELLYERRETHNPECVEDVAVSMVVVLSRRLELRATVSWPPTIALDVVSGTYPP
jgi:hypothetical protein